MKNKKLTYLLLPAVALIWGIIFYRIFISSGQDGHIQGKTPGLDMVAADTLQIHDYPLTAKYPDPFLKHDFTKQAASSVSQPLIKREQFEVKAQERPRYVNWPEILYSGMISKESQQNIGLVEVNRNKGIVSEGLVFNKVKVLRLYPDSVVMEFENEIKTYNKLK